MRALEPQSSGVLTFAWTALRTATGLPFLVMVTRSQVPCTALTSSLSRFLASARLVVAMAMILARSGDVASSTEDSEETADCRRRCCGG